MILAIWLLCGAIGLVPCYFLFRYFLLWLFDRKLRRDGFGDNL